MNTSAFGHNEVISDTLYYKIEGGCEKVLIGSENIFGNRKGLWINYTMCNEQSKDTILKEVYWKNGRIVYEKEYYDSVSYYLSYFDRFGRTKKVIIIINGIQIFKKVNRQILGVGYLEEHYKNGEIKEFGKLIRIKRHSELTGKYFVKHGKWKKYNENGELIGIFIYKKGELINQ